MIKGVVTDATGCLSGCTDVCNSKDILTEYRCYDGKGSPYLVDGENCVDGRFEFRKVVGV